MIARWKGTDTKQNVTYDFLFDQRAKETKYHIQFHMPELIARKLRNYFALLKQVREVSIIRITNLETEMTIEQECSGLFGKRQTLQEEMSQRLIEALVTIEEMLGLIIPVPKSIDKELLSKAEWVSEALRDGAVKINPNDFIPENAVLICGDSAIVVRQMLAEFEREGRIFIVLHSSATEIEVDLVDQTLNLGVARYMCGNVRIINADELRSVLSQENITNETTVNTVFEVDRDEVYLGFEKWGRNE
jgi:hypothetical protein